MFAGPNQQRRGFSAAFHYPTRELPCGLAQGVAVGRTPDLLLAGAELCRSQPAGSPVLLAAGEATDGARVLLDLSGGQLHVLGHPISAPFFLAINPEKILSSAPPPQAGCRAVTWVKSLWRANERLALSFINYILSSY